MHNLPLEPESRDRGLSRMPHMPSRPWSDDPGSIGVGRLIREPRGQNGFGYDPIFVPDSAAITTAEMDPADKDRISHRGKALRGLAPVIAAFLG